MANLHSIISLIRSAVSFVLCCLFCLTEPLHERFEHSFLFIRNQFNVFKPRSINAMHYKHRPKAWKLNITMVGWK